MIVHGQPAGSPSLTIINSKELIAGYTLIQVQSRGEAMEWSRRFPNPSRTNGEIEVRQLFELDDFAPNEAIDRFLAMDESLQPAKAESL